MSDRPHVSEKAVELIDAALRTQGDANAEAMYGLHRYIERLERLEKRRRSVPTTAVSSLNTEHTR